MGSFWGEAGGTVSAYCILYCTAWHRHLCIVTDIMAPHSEDTYGIRNKLNILQNHIGNRLRLPFWHVHAWGYSL